jgi:hypothetical protein
MAVTVTIEDRIFHIVFSGPVTFEALAAACQSAMARPEFSPPMKALIDVPAVSRSVPWNEIRDMVDFSVMHKNKFARRCAIVCEQGSLVYGLARMFCAMAEYYELDYTLFADLGAAREWVSQTRPQVTA